ncbi:hypothetical protein SRCM101294_02648 [Bacillus amyloliquefaciens]|nr:hypothetical protein SRCM101294_02648 [Bacillus amyloliquefaciens]
MKKSFMPKNIFREGIVFMNTKGASAFILFIVLLGFLGHYLVSNPSEFHEARRGQTASVDFAGHKQVDFKTVNFENIS